MKVFVKIAVAIGLAALPTQAFAGTGANVQCWAPGMPNVLTLDSYGQGVGVYCGRPYSYKIYGVAGSLALGDQCDGAFTDPADNSGRFRSGWWIGALGGYVNVTSFMYFQVNGSGNYPRKVQVTGDRAGAKVGPVRLYGETWESMAKFGYPETTVVFHMAGGGDSAIPNRNPSGYFYIVGEYIASPPAPTGKLTISPNSVQFNSTTPVGYTITRAGSGGTGQTPPFTGYNTTGEVVFLAGQG